MKLDTRPGEPITKGGQGVLIQSWTYQVRTPSGVKANGWCLNHSRQWHSQLMIKRRTSMSRRFVASFVAPVHLRRPDIDCIHKGLDVPERGWLDSTMTVEHYACHTHREDE